MKNIFYCTIPACITVYYVVAERTAIFDTSLRHKINLIDGVWFWYVSSIKNIRNRVKSRI